MRSASARRTSLRELCLTSVVRSRRIDKCTRATMPDRRHRAAATSDPIIPAHAAVAQSLSTKAASKGAAGAGFCPRQQYRSSLAHLEAKDAARRRLQGDAARTLLRETVGAGGATEIRGGAAHEKAGAEAGHSRRIDRGQAEEASWRRCEAPCARNCCSTSISRSSRQITYPSGHTSRRFMLGFVITGRLVASTGDENADCAPAHSRKGAASWNGVTLASQSKLSGYG